MSKAKLVAARELIKEKKYNEARILLKSIDDPIAQDWLSKLDKIAPDKKKPQSLLGIVGLALVFVVLVTVLVFVVVGRGNPNTIAMVVGVTVSPPLTDVPASKSTWTSSPASTIVPTTDVVRATVNDNLLSFCVIPVSMLAALEAGGTQVSNLYPAPILVTLRNRRDVEGACEEWVDAILSSNLYGTAEFCQNKADAEFRPDTMTECLLERNFLQSFFPDSQLGYTENLNLWIEVFTRQSMFDVLAPQIRTRYGFS